MKKISTFLILMAIAISGFTQWKDDSGKGNLNYAPYHNNYKNCVLIIKVFIANPFIVVVDNGYQLMSNRNTVNVGVLNSGMHNILIYQWRSNFWGKQKREIVYSNGIYLKPNMETALSINAFGRVNIFEKGLYREYGNEHNRDNKRSDDDWEDKKYEDNDGHNGRH